MKETVNLIEDNSFLIQQQPEEDSHMSFQEAVKKLGIESYSDRIWHSNSHGELFHLLDYIAIAESFKDVSWFPKWFEFVVKQAEEKWSRPESIFQHIGTVLEQSLEAALTKKV